MNRRNPNMKKMTEYNRGGQLFLSAGRIRLLFVSRGPNSGQICFFKAKNGAFSGRMLPLPALLDIFLLRHVEVLTQ